MIRIFSIENHPVTVTGLKNLFRPSRDEIGITGCVSNVDEAVRQANPDTFDIFLLDLLLPDAHPFSNVKKLKVKFPGKPIVIFTSEDSSIWKHKMFEAGVMAYLLKSANKNEIKTTLEKVFKGQVVFSGIAVPENKKKLSNLLSGKRNHLTVNQQNLIILLCAGLTQQQIADKKKISVSTVEKTLKHIRENFGAKNIAELVKILFEKGLI